MSFNQPLRKRMFGKEGRYDPIGIRGTTASGRRQRQIKCMGRDKPDPPQAAVVVTVFFLKNEQALRKQALGNIGMIDDLNARLLAPFGSDQCFNVMQGALVFARKQTLDLQSMPAHVSANPVSDIIGFECVNGLPVGTSLIFVGWAATDNLVTDASRENIGTVQVVGTCTAINTGPNTIPAMSCVYFDEQPYVIQTSTGVYPVVVEVGQPGSEHSEAPAKFRPATYALTDVDIASNVQQCELRVETMMAAKMKSSATKDEKFFTQLVKDMDALVTEFMDNRPPSMPLRDIMWTHFFQLYLLHRRDASTRELILLAREAKDRVVNTLHKLRNAFNDAIGERNDAQGALFGIFKTLSNTPTHALVKKAAPKKPAPSKKSAKKADMDEDDDKPTSDIDSPADPQAVFECGKALLRIKDVLVVTLRSWFSDHFIGHAMVTSEPGTSLHLNLRFGGS
jgi:hypothetical protein